MRVGYGIVSLLVFLVLLSPLTAEDGEWESSGDDDSLTFTTQQIDVGLSGYNSDLQKLRDFRDLLRKGISADEYFHTVGWVYRKSGFRALGTAIARSRFVFRQVADPRGHRVTRKQAAAAVRHLQIALRDTPRYLPKFTKKQPYELGIVSATEVTYPNYTGLAYKFLTDLQCALENAAKGRRVTTRMPAAGKRLWLRVNLLASTVLANGPVFEGGTVTTSSGVSSYGSGTYISAAGISSVSGGMLVMNPISLTGSAFYYAGTSGTHWLAFSPGISIPSDLLPSAPSLILTADYKVNGVHLTTGTRIYSVADSYPTPDGAVVLSGPSLSAAIEAAE